jgi:hypothetical protein
LFCKTENEQSGRTFDDDLRRRKRSFFIGHFTAQFKDAMEAFDVTETNTKFFNIFSLKTNCFHSMLECWLCLI